MCIGQLPEDAARWCRRACSLDIVGAEYVRDVEPSEMVRFTAAGMVSEQAVPPPAGHLHLRIRVLRPTRLRA
ncbi:MAG: hypothetical protein ACLTMP_13630 [Eggerthella lenta]